MIMIWHHAYECSQRQTKIPHQPDRRVLLKVRTPGPELVRSRRQFAAWTGLTPTDHSTAG
jgi:transposase